jgi:hypothetical protein
LFLLATDYFGKSGKRGKAKVSGTLQPISSYPAVRSFRRHLHFWPFLGLLGGLSIRPAYKGRGCGNQQRDKQAFSVDEEISTSQGRVEHPKSP